jgi:transposase-like protein
MKFLLKVDGQNYWLWLDYDEPNLHVCLLFHISRERTIFVCYQFFRQIRTRFGNKPMFTDDAQWYNDACRWLRLNMLSMEQSSKISLKGSFSRRSKENSEYFDDVNFL